MASTRDPVLTMTSCLFGASTRTVILRSKVRRRIRECGWGRDPLAPVSEMTARAATSDELE